MGLQEYAKIKNSDFRRDFQERSAKCKFNFGNKVARGAGFDLAVDRAPLRVRVLQFLLT